jgi:hypothetical protein
MGSKPRNIIKQLRTRRYIVPSDTSWFVGRVFDLSILGMWFDSYEELEPFPDIRYAFQVNQRTTLMVDRVESLNRVGNLLWPSKADLKSKFPMSRYDWLSLITDLFLVRLISVFDCCLLLTNEILELGLDARNCKIHTLTKNGAPPSITIALQRLLDDQEKVRIERNYRVHEAWGQDLTEDDIIFRSLAQMEYLCGTKECQNPDGSKTHIRVFYNAARDGLRKEFNKNCRTLVEHLDPIYSLLSSEFEVRFSAKWRSHSRLHPIYGGR